MTIVARAMWLLLLPATSSLSAQSIPDSLANQTWDALAGKLEANANVSNYSKCLLYARALMERVLLDSTKNSLAYGSSLDYLGFSLHHCGYHTEAEQTLLAAVEHARLYLGESHEDYITRLSNLAMLHLDMGETPKAASELETAVALCEKHLKPDNPYRAIMVNNLGLVYEKMHMYDLSLNYYLRAMELTEQTVGKDNPRYSIRLHNVANILRKLEKHQVALEYDLRAVAIAEKNSGKNNRRYIVSRHGLMIDYIELKQYDKALEISEELLAYIANNPQNVVPEISDFRQSIGYLYYKAGMNERALQITKETLEECRSLFPTLNSKFNALAEIATMVLEKMGRIPEAAEYALLQNQFCLKVLQGSFSEFTEQEQLKHADLSLRRTNESPLRFSIIHEGFPELAAAAYNYEMTMKGGALANRRRLFQSLRKNQNAGQEAQFEDWKYLQNEISRQYAVAPARRKPNLDSLITRANELERDMAIRSELFHQAQEIIEWKDVQAALSPGEAAIEFGRIELNDPRIKTLKDSVVYVAWIIRPGDRFPRQRVLFEEKSILPLNAIKQLYAPESGPKNLGQLIWAPLQDDLEGVTTIYFAPDGLLHQVNLGAIPINATEVMVDRFKMHCMISTRQIPAFKKTPRQFTPTNALVFGGIRYESDSLALAPTNAMSQETLKVYPETRNRGVSMGEDWGYLSGTLQEAQSVKQRLESRGIHTTYATGFDASEGYFKKNAGKSPAPELLHLATHGFFLAVQDTNAQTGFATADNPMARAGLVLAGANKVWSGGEPLQGQEDGILTAMEISRMDLSGTQLAVLSACGTGQGKLEDGEGVFGLQRAFKMAGVNYLILTLWNVQDSHAQRFMDLFYDAWLTRQMSIPDAFRDAQRNMRQQFSKPFQPMAWAGFILLE